MRIPVKNSNGSYLDFSIQYYYIGSDGRLTNAVFGTVEQFQEFMSECHPDINTDEFIAKYGKRLSYLTALAEGGDHKTKPSTTLFCFVAGDCIMSSFYYCGIMEKWHDYHDGHEKANEGYLHTFVAHNWQFNQLPTGIMKISYWYDKTRNELPTYKVHMFKDKVVFENANGTVHTIVVSDRFYIYYEGAKKPEQ